MKQTFKSKVGIELWAPIMMLLGTIILLLKHGMIISYVAIIFPLATIGFILFLWLRTDYVVEYDKLKIFSAFNYKRRISIHSITKIKETREPAQGPALSLDRLKVEYGLGGSVLISPRNKKDFIKALKRQNNSIKVIHRKALSKGEASVFQEEEGD